MGSDAVLIAIAYLTALVFRFDGSIPHEYWDRFMAFLPLALVVHLAVQRTLGLYRAMWRFASIIEARKALTGGAISSVILLALSPLGSPRMPYSVVIVGGLLATSAVGLIRFRSRLFAFRRAPVPGSEQRVVVVGAGEAGSGLVRDLLRSERLGMRPVTVVDDDPRKIGRTLHGVPVLGPISSLARIAAEEEAHQLLLAMPSASSATVQDVIDVADSTGVALRVLPPVHERLHGKPSVRDVRDINIEDLLGRQQVEIDLDLVSAMLRDRRVLITGAGGSIGSEIARQVATLAPSTLVLLDHDETHLHEVASVIDRPVVQALCDIRDASDLCAVFERHRPEIVFHAAAHKHVPLLEDHPREAVRTNVIGAANLIDAADRVAVNRLVFISTDKAVRPSSVMGASKWFGEQLVLSAAHGRPWCAVRFGNVVGSRGSVIPTFARQISSGGPVTVTDPRMTRYFMSVHEAVRLVLQSAVMAHGGEIFELEMGEPVNILDLANKMIDLTVGAGGERIPISFTGMRPGEKLEEQLHAPDESANSTSHPSVVRLEPRRLSPIVLSQHLSGLAELVERAEDAALAERMLSVASGWYTDDDDVLDLRSTSDRDSMWTRSLL